MLPREVRLALPSWVDEVVGPPRAWRGTEEKMALAIRLSHPQRGVHYYLRRSGK